MVLVLLFLKRKLFWSSTVYKCSSHCTLHWENSDTCHSCNTFVLRCVYGWVKFPSDPFSDLISNVIWLSAHSLAATSKDYGTFFSCMKSFHPQGQTEAWVSACYQAWPRGSRTMWNVYWRKYETCTKRRAEWRRLVFTLLCHVENRFLEDGVGFFLISLSWETKQKILKGALAIF